MVLDYDIFHETINDIMDGWSGVVLYRLMKNPEMRNVQIYACFAEEEKYRVLDNAVMDDSFLEILCENLDQPFMSFEFVGEVKRDETKPRHCKNIRV